MSNENINVLIIKIVKKVNFIELLESALVLLRECYNKNMSASETSEEIKFFLKDKNLEEDILSNFMTLINSLISFYPYKPLFSKHLRTMVIILFSLKNEACLLLHELLSSLYNSENPFYQNIYAIIESLLNKGIEPYLILLKLRDSYQYILKQSEKKEEEPGSRGV